MTEAVIENAPAETGAPAATTPPASTPSAQNTPSGDSSAPNTTPGDAGKSEANTPPEPIWRADWREKMAGDLPETATADEKAEHDKLLKRLQRFNSPSDAAKAIREHDKLFSSGQLKKALPKNATEAQVAEWRKENGIPEAPDKYDLGLPKDVELTELDQQMLGSFVSKAHGANASPEVVKAVAATYMEMRNVVAQQMNDRDSEAKNNAVEVLRSEWGHDYKSNIDGLDSFLKNAPSAVSESIYNARSADGVRILNNPDVARWLASHARNLGFVGATVVPSGGDIGKTIDDEIKSIEGQMFKDDGTRNPDYWKSDVMQNRYKELFAAKARRENK